LNRSSSTERDALPDRRSPRRSPVVARNHGRPSLSFFTCPFWNSGDDSSWACEFLRKSLKFTFL